MKKKILLLLCMMLTATFNAMAQNKAITGTLTDKDTNEGVIQATVQLLKQDSSYIKGVLTNENGDFKITAPSNGNYILKVTSVGYKTLFKKVHIADNKNINFGKMTFSTDAIMLKGATITGHAAKVVVKEDTFEYNASAYRTPEGSVAEELVKRLPGAQIDDDGKITINGKEVKKILVDGKEFMTGDTKTAMKNLPTNIIDKIKTYDEKSDLAKVTGIDDGNEQTVLDFGIKKGMNKGMFSNADASIGTHSRYAERLMGAMFKDKTRVMLMGNANNTNDMGFPGGGGGRFGGNRQGLNATKMIGGNFNYNNDNKLILDGSLRWNHSNSNLNTQESTENFVSQQGSFTNSNNQNYTRSNSWDARLRLEWKPDSLTDILFRPNFTYSTSDGLTKSNSASFNEDPYLYTESPLSTSGLQLMADKNLAVNSRESSSISFSKSKNVNAMLQVNRKLSNKGRNATLRADIGYTDSKSQNLSLSNVHLYQIKNVLGNDSIYSTNRYNTTPTKSWNYSLTATYSEPLWRSAFLQFSYKFTYKYNKSDRATYDLIDTDNLFNGLSPIYRGWNNYLNLLPGSLSSYYDDKLSRYSEYKNYIHEAQAMLRILKDKYQFNIGMMVQPQQTRFIQHYQKINTDTIRNVVNVSPTLDFRYRFSKVSNLRINYRGTTSQPSMSDLLDITDDSDPLNITKGNPGLKPSFTNNFRLFYNTYLQEHQRAIMTFVNYSNTRNSISNLVTYDEKTGGRTTRPENINGNWNVSGAFMFNTAIDSTGYWNINTFTNINYNNYVGYVSIDNKSNSQKNTTRTTSLAERLSGSFRNSWLEVSLDGSVNYTHARNLLQSQNNLDTWQFAYGGSLNFYMPWGMSIATDMHQNSRRGFNDNSMNTNELIWNAQLSQSFLKGKALTLSLQFYDILHNQSNFSRTINAMQRSDVQYNSINSYAMLHVVYRINLFGGKQKRSNREEQRFDPGRPGNRPDGSGRPEGMPPFGGGGRPPRF